MHRYALLSAITPAILLYMMPYAGLRFCVPHDAKRVAMHSQTTTPSGEKVELVISESTEPLNPIKMPDALRTGMNTVFFALPGKLDTWLTGQRYTL